MDSEGLEDITLKSHTNGWRQISDGHSYLGIKIEAKTSYMLLAGLLGKR